jgi:hypothetical protein
MGSRPGDGRRAARIAWALCALSATLGLASVVLAVLVDASLADFVVEYAALGPVVGIASPLLGALVIARYPGNRIGWVLCAIGLGLAVTMFGSGYAEYTVITRPGVLPGGRTVGWFYNWAWMPVMGLLPFLFLLFPDGRLRSRRWLPVAWATVVNLTVPPAVVAVISWRYRLDPEQWASEELVPVAAPEFPLVDATEQGFFLATTLLIAAGMASVLARLRWARGVERQQVKWFLYGGGAAVAVTAFTVAFPRFETGITALATFAGLLGAIAVAIFRYRLYDIDRIINRTIVYGLLTGLLGLVYTAGVFATGRLLDPAGGQSELAVAASTLAVAALFQPARRRIQLAVDRRFNRRRYDATRTVAAFSARLRDEVDLDTLSAELLEVVDQTVQPARASLWLRSPGTAPGSR